MQELIHGPIEKWNPSQGWTEQARAYLEHEDDLHRAYGEVMMAGCFVKEFQGIAAVGEMDKIALIEFRTGENVDISNLSMGDCFSLGTYPGTGETRADAIRNGLQHVLELREKVSDELDLFGSFTENGFRVDAYMPANAQQPTQWTVKVFNEGEEEPFRTEIVPMLYEPVFGVDVGDKEMLERRVDDLMDELNNK